MELLLENGLDRELSHEELIEQYKESLAPILEKRKALKIKIDELGEIISDKKVSKLIKNEAVTERQLLQAEDKPYQGIQGDLEFAIAWLKTGHQPGVVRGIERRSVYQNTKSFDPLLMQRYFSSHQPMFPWDTEPKGNTITLSERIIIDKAMAALTEKELEVYLMFKGRGFSQYSIAKFLGISRSSVQKMIKRADIKVAKIISEEKDGENQ